MSAQLDFFAPIEAIERIENETIEQRFLRFHARNPHVYAALAAYANRAIKAGRTRIAIAQLWEILRWDRIIWADPNVGDERRLNNDYRSYYARLLMEQEPDLAGCFETRRLRSAA